MPQKPGSRNEINEYLSGFVIYMRYMAIAETSQHINDTETAIFLIAQSASVTTGCAQLRETF